MRFPVAAKIALHSAGAKGGTPGSPTPLGCTSIEWSTMCTRVSRGDAIFVRSGQALRERRDGPIGEGPREGLLAEAVPWLHEREIAVYSGDCIERMPSGYERVPMPLHQVGMVAMGLAILDCADCERLAEACRARGRATFCLVVAPLRVPGGSASAVNPLALF